MLNYNINEVLEFRLPVEYLPFPVDNILLQVKGHIFSDAEVFHRIRNTNPEFAANPEKMIYTGFAGKNHCSKIKYIDFLVPEIFCRYSLNLHKWFKVYFQVILLGELEIW